MFFSQLHYIPLIAAAAASMALGFAWYSPLLFASRWMKEMRHTPEELEALKQRNLKKGMAISYSLMSAFSLATALVIASLLNSLVVIGIGGLIMLAGLLWLAFSAPVAASQVMYGKGTWTLFAIDSGYRLVSIILMTLIIGISG